MYELKKLPNGFEYLEIKNDKASAKIALQGAHIFDYKRNDKTPILWLSEISDFKLGKAIRGGVPLCWPRFGNLDKELPQHGFARTFLFDLVDVEELDSNTTKVHLQLKNNEKSHKIWDYKFQLDFTVIISDTLVMKLKTTNKDTKDFEITQALHSYFTVSNIDEVKINGLDKKPYLDALSMKTQLQNGEISFSGEVDRVYQEVDSAITLEDKSRKINIQNQGSSSVIVWNPWIEKCSKMSAMKNDAYKKFVCIESANAFEDVRVIKVNNSHTLKTTIF